MTFSKLLATLPSRDFDQIGDTIQVGRHLKLSRRVQRRKDVLLPHSPPQPLDYLAHPDDPLRVRITRLGPLFIPHLLELRLDPSRLLILLHLLPLVVLQISLSVRSACAQVLSELSGNWQRQHRPPRLLPLVVQAREPLEGVEHVFEHGRVSLERVRDGRLGRFGRQQREPESEAQETVNRCAIDLYGYDGYDVESVKLLVEKGMR